MRDARDIGMRDATTTDKTRENGCDARDYRRESWEERQERDQDVKMRGKRRGL